MDKCKLSERDTRHLLHAFRKAVNLDLCQFIINRTFIRKKRNVFPKLAREKNEKYFLEQNVESITIYWDGKMFSKTAG